MDILKETKPYDTIRVRFEEDICYLQLYRPEVNNTVNARLIDECTQVLRMCEQSAKIVVLEGLPDVFCFGADFQEIQESYDRERKNEQDPTPLYNLWLQLACGSFVTIAHVRGKTNAGGIGFVAACDVVLCEEKAVFSLSELLFGLIPACVLPFLIRRMGFSKAHYLTLMTQPISAKQAQTWGLVDACDEKSEDLLRKHLLRLRRLSKPAISRYKSFMNDLNDFFLTSRSKAIEMNREVFSDLHNLEMISRYVRTGKFPWDGD